jgi:hypothetical protein
VACAAFVGMLIRRKRVAPRFCCAEILQQGTCQENAEPFQSWRLLLLSYCSDRNYCYMTSNAHSSMLLLAWHALARILVDEMIAGKCPMHVLLSASVALPHTTLMIQAINLSYSFFFAAG